MREKYIWKEFVTHKANMCSFLNTFQLYNVLVIVHIRQTYTQANSYILYRYDVSARQLKVIRSEYTNRAPA